MISRPCWRCGSEVGEGYQIEFRLIGPNRPPSPPYVTANVCWPCIQPINDALGERAARPHASGSAEGEGE